MTTRNNDLLRLFAPRADGKTVLDDLRIATALLNNMCGEIGFGVSRHIVAFVAEAERILRGA